MSLSERAIEIMTARGFDVEILGTIGIETVERGGGDWISIPYRKGGDVINHKYRTIGMPGQNYDKKMGQDADAEKVFWNVDVLADATLAREPLIITEGEFDALAFVQAGYQRVMSVPDGAPKERAEDVFRDRQTKYSYLFDVLSEIKKAETVILATDCDPSGIILRDELAQIIGRPMCKFLPFPKDAKRHGKACKDAADVLERYGVDGVKLCVSKAGWLRTNGVYRYSDLPPEDPRIAFPSGMVDGAMDAHLKVRLGDLLVLLGVPGFGKSTWLNDFCASMANLYGWHTAFFSPEQFCSDHRADLMQRQTGKERHHCSADELDRAGAWVEENIRFIESGDEEDMTLDWLLEKAEQAVIQHGCKIIVVDPWNEMDHIYGSRMSETEYTGLAIREMKRFAKRHKVLVIVAHHPVKMEQLRDGNYVMPSPYNASGSANWFNKADAFVVVHRAGDETILRVAKLKKHGLMGRPGDLHVKFDRTLMRYYGGDQAESEAAA